MTDAIATTPPERITRLVDAVVAPPGPLLLVSDFDGTLAPITSEPLATRIVPAARTALRRLSRIAATRPDRLRVVVLSGRSALDVAGRVRVGGLTYQGNHGIEVGRLARGGRAERLEVATDAALAVFVAQARALAEAVGRRLGHPDWLLVEDKGPTVAFHFRQAPDPDRARTTLLETIAAIERDEGEHGLVAFEGRKVVEFRPVGVGGKGTAVARLIERGNPAAVLVLGDDRSDAEAFAAVRSARADGRLRGLALAVHGATETPPEILATADGQLPDPPAAARVLSRVAGLLEREKDGPARA